MDQLRTSGKDEQGNMHYFQLGLSVQRSTFADRLAEKKWIKKKKIIFYLRTDFLTTFN
jgi:hypothetical protein